MQYFDFGQNGILSFTKFPLLVKRNCNLKSTPKITQKKIEKIFLKEYKNFLILNNIFYIFFKKLFNKSDTESF
jgi:hypothetical protein